MNPHPLQQVTELAMTNFHRAPVETQNSSQQVVVQQGRRVGYRASLVDERAVRHRKLVE